MLGLSYSIRKRKIITCIGLLLVFFLSLSLDFWSMNYEEFTCVKLPLFLLIFFFYLLLLINFIFTNSEKK